MKADLAELKILKSVCFIKKYNLIEGSVEKIKD